ncbi:MAG: GlsB/YeaQ/YmgE family stress response membrane protein [Arachnia sp.]
MIGYILIGLLAGAIAKAILPGRQSGGWIATGLLGIVGAFVGGFLSDVLVHRSPAVFSVGGLIWAVIGSLVVLAVSSWLSKRKQA